jgi:hypothetical protein
MELLVDQVVAQVVLVHHQLLLELAVLQLQAVKV